MSYVIRSKVNAVLNRHEDPMQTLDYSYEQMRDELQTVKRGIADLTTQKKRLEIQQRNLQEDIEKHNDQARQAVEQDREDLARRALEKKKTKMSQLEDLEGQISQLDATQDGLIEKKNELQKRIEEFRTEKETMKARHEAAKASSTVSEAMTGVGDEMGEVSQAIERMEDKTEEMEARSEAMTELRESGAIEGPLSDESDLESELESVRVDGEVESELETLQSETGEGSTRDEGEEQADAGQVEGVRDDEIEKELAELKE